MSKVYVDIEFHDNYSRIVDNIFGETVTLCRLGRTNISQCVKLSIIFKH